MKIRYIGWMMLLIAVTACMLIPTATPPAAPAATSTAAPTATPTAPVETQMVTIPTENEIPPAATEGFITVMVYFTISDPVTMHLRAVPRQIPSSEFESTTISNTLKELLKGPTDAERAQGLASWFNSGTADSLTGVAVVMAGDVSVDFAGLSGKIPNASTSAGSLMLISQLNSTVFQFPFVNRVEYTMDGSCQSFWEWLQSECHAITRAEWQLGPTP